jgi:hypothetical protein
MNSPVIQGLNLNIEELRTSIREEYSAVANEPEQGFHFHTGRKLAGILGTMMNGWRRFRPALSNRWQAQATPSAWVSSNRANMF